MAFSENLNFKPFFFHFKQVQELVQQRHDISPPGNKRQRIFLHQTRTEQAVAMAVVAAAGWPLQPLLPVWATIPIRYWRPRLASTALSLR